MLRLTSLFALAVLLLGGMIALPARASSTPGIAYEGGEGPGKGKHVVLVSGDEEYRSEEALPQLAKILATQHGFTCTVLFAINPRTGLIDPTHVKNIPGMEALDTADLLVIFTRFRDLPEEQMAPLDRYLKSGKPVIGLRTSTHAFNAPVDSPWGHYGNGYAGEKKEWHDGFGRLVLGEHWINHHGEHKQEGTRGLLAPEAKDHPILRGLADGDVWGSTDVYGVRLPLPGDSMPLVLGQVVKRAGAYDGDDVHYGMRPSDAEPVAGEKNDPMMPVAWTKSYQLPEGTKGQVFTTTLGSGADLLIPGTRRLLVNAVYWTTGLADQIPAEGTRVEIVGEYAPTKYEFRTPAYWRDRAMTPAEHALAK
jgi:hypothetical protein